MHITRMSESKTKRDPIPQEFKSIAEAGEFGDTHSLADYWDLTREAEFKVDLGASVYLVAVEKNLIERLTERAQAQGLSTQTLVNLYLSERLATSSSLNDQLSQGSGSIEKPG